MNKNKFTSLTLSLLLFNNIDSTTSEKNDNGIIFVGGGKKY